MARALSRECLSCLPDMPDEPLAAARAIEAIDLASAAEKVRAELEFVALSAVLLGASQFSIDGRAGRTTFAQDREVPVEVQSQIEQTVRFMSGAGAQAVRRRAVQVANAAAAEDPTIGGVGVDDGLIRAILIRKQFGRGQLAEALNRAVREGTKVQASLAANLTTTRLAAYGGLHEAAALGVTTYQWDARLHIEREGPCAFCSGMHGRVFQVQPNLNRLAQVVRSQDPDTARSLMPWPDQAQAGIQRLSGWSNDKLSTEGFSLPPAHPKCYCVVVPVGSVPASEFVGFRPRPPKVPAREAAGLGPADAVTVFEEGGAAVEGAVIEAPAAGRPYVPQAQAGSTEAMWSKDGKWLAERVAQVHDPAVAHLLKGKARVPLTQRPTLEFLGGGSGAGKGTIQRLGYVKVPKRMVAVDADELKGFLPEYVDMKAAKDVRAAAFAHEESSYLSKRAASEAVATRRDLLLDGTGDSGIEKLSAKLDAARKAGYRIKGDYVTISADEAVRRALERAVRSGRMVPESVIRQIHRDVSRDFAAAIERGLFDEARLWDNSGETPILVLQQKAGKTKILRQDLWDAFLRKADEDVGRTILTEADLARVTARKQRPV